MEPPVGLVSASALAEALKGPTPPVVVDVREPWEYELARIPGSIHLPLGAITRQWEHLEPEAETVVVCHHGFRSMQAAMFLASVGFTRVKNLTGGIDAWSVQVDPATPRY